LFIQEACMMLFFKMLHRAYSMSVHKC